MELISDNNKFLNVGLLLLATIIVAKLISLLIMPRFGKRPPPMVGTFPVHGEMFKFLGGLIVLLREEYPNLGSVFTLNLLNKKITFFINLKVSTYLFKAFEFYLSQQEVYQFNVPTCGPGVIFDVDYSTRQGQFRFFTKAHRVTTLKAYVEQMVSEAHLFSSVQLQLP